MRKHLGIKKRTNHSNLGERGKMIEKWKHNLDKFIKKIVDNKKSRYIVIIALMGIILIIVSNIFSTKENVTSQIEHETYSEEKDEDIEDVSLNANVNEIEENNEKDRK